MEEEEEYGPMSVQELQKVSESEFPGHGQWIAELIHPFQHVGHTLRLQLPAANLNHEAAAEIKWHAVNGVVILAQYPPADAQQLSFTVSEDLLREIRHGHIIKDDELIEKTIDFVREVLRCYEAAALKNTQEVDTLFPLPCDPELSWVINRNLTQNLILRNVLKLLIATILSKLSSNSRYDCTAILQRWRNGNFLLGFTEREGKAVYLCGPAANPKKY